MSNQQKEQNHEFQAYDKIVRENISQLLFPLAKKQLGIPIEKTEEIKDKLQTTIAREGDFLRIVTTKTGETFILHLEFQVKDEAKMVYRMQEYYAILRKKYQLPIKQFVYYLGEKPSKMPTQLPEEEVYRGFELQSFRSIPYTGFLNSEIPEEIMLAMLADFGKEKAETIIEKIFDSLLQLKTEKILLEKYIRQMVILARLRSNLVNTVTQKIEQRMDFIIDVEHDQLYQRGMEKGIEKGMEKGEYTNAVKTAKVCLLEGFDMMMTAKISGLSKEKIQEIANELGR